MTRVVAQVRRHALAASLSAIVMLALVGAAPALAQSPYWSLTSSPAPTNLVPGGSGTIVVTASNLGDTAMIGKTSEITVIDKLPPGLTLAARPTGVLGANPAVELTCTPRTIFSKEPVKCTYNGLLQPSEGLRIRIPVNVDGSLASGATLQNEISAEGGEGPATTTPVRQAVKVSSEPAQFGIEKYELKPEEEGGAPDAQAGSHPFQLSTTLAINDTSVEEPVALVKNLEFELPPGLIGTTKLPRCTDIQFTTLGQGNNLCPYQSAVGVAEVTINEPVTFPKGPTTRTVPVFNLVPAPGEPARFGFVALKDPVVLNTSVRTGSDYGVTVTAKNTSEAAGFLSSEVSFWGVPANPRHNASRGWECVAGGTLGAGLPPCSAQKPQTEEAFLTLPASCPAETKLNAPVRAQSWVPGASLLEAVNSEFQEQLTGCGELKFEPKIEVEPEQHSGSTPAGLTVDVSLPQQGIESPTGLAEADVKETTVALPEGMLLNPAAANGLEACSLLSFGGLEGGLPEAAQTENDHFTPTDPACPDAAKVGTVEITTPVLKENLKGSVYLAAEHTNPFEAPLVIYLVAKNPISGVLVKLAGKVTPNPATGQVVTTFENTPQVPFSDLKFKFFGGPRASLSTPPLCGTYTTQASMTPWAGSVATPSAQFEITSGPGGGPCPATQPFTPSFKAGPTNTQAAGFTNFILTLATPDGQQALTGLEMTLPQGAAGMLSSLTPCQEPPLGQEWTCGPESLVGHSTSVSGLGKEPVTLSGNVYLTSGYDGAPFGLLAETLAKAGPFNLGKVDVRSRINVNRETAAVTITTDPGPRGEALPAFLKGVPVQLKELNVTVDRPNFEFNPTNCSPLSVNGTLHSAGNASVGV
jgi:hypothetical protein